MLEIEHRPLGMTWDILFCGTPAPGLITVNLQVRHTTKLITFTDYIQSFENATKSSLQLSL
jgi:hypothetical protein